MRLIDAERLKAVLEKNFGHTGGASVLEQLIDEQPTIQPVATDTNVGDTISRQAAIDEIKSVYEWHDTVTMERLIEHLNNLPPIQPEQHEGHWIPHESPDGGEQYECSECGVLWEFNDGTPEDNEAYYCPKCGNKLITK